MQLIITARHFDITEGIKEHIKEKVAKFEKYSKKIIEAHVILNIEHERQMAEIILSGADLKLLGKGETGDMYTSIDKASGKIEQQLRSHKEKVKHHKSKPLKEDESLSKDQEQASLIIEDKRDFGKPISPEEAVLELDMQGLDFLVFKDRADHRKKVIYRRRDNNYGLIVSE